MYSGTSLGKCPSLENVLLWECEHLGPKEASFIKRLFLLCPLFRGSTIRGSTVLVMNTYEEPHLCQSQALHLKCGYHSHCIPGNKRVKNDLKHCVQLESPFSNCPSGVCPKQTHQLTFHSIH